MALRRVQRFRFHIRHMKVICREAVLQNVGLDLFLSPFPGAGCIRLHTDHPEIGIILMLTIIHTSVMSYKRILRCE